MRYCFMVITACCFIAAAAIAQDYGAVKCREENAVEALERPESLVVVKMLPCEEVVRIIGRVPGYYNVQAGRITGYVASEYIRLVPAPEPPMETNEVQREKPPKPAPDSRPPQVATTPLALMKFKEEKPAGRQGILVGLDLSHRIYQEPGVMKEKGVMLGVYGEYELRPRNFMFKIDGRLQLGSVDYSSYETGKVDDIGDFVFESRLLLGPVFKATEKTRFIPYAGFGYRYLFDDAGGRISTTGHIGYDRKTKYLYTPLGLTAEFSLRNGWSLSASGEYGLFWRGWQYSRLGDVYSWMPTITNTQHDGWGTRGGIRFMKNLGKLDLAIEPYFMYWDIDRSNYAYYDLFYEPANNTRDWGARIAIRF